MNVSVVIPVKNRPTSVVRAIESAMRQTHRPDLVIVVDDGSTDDTPAVLASMSRALGGIQYVRLEQSCGAPIARNSGAELATGEFVAFLDSDDVWKPSKLEKQLKLFSEYPAASAVFSGFEYHYPKKALRTSIPPKVVRCEDLFERNVLGGTSSVIVRKTAFNDVGRFMPGMPSCQDWELWLRLADWGPLICVQEPLVEYHFDGGGRISKNRANVETGHSIVFNAINSRVNDPGALKKLKARQAIRMSEVYAKQFHDGISALGQIKQALSLDATPKNMYGGLVALAHLVV